MPDEHLTVDPDDLRRVWLLVRINGITQGRFVPPQIYEAACKNSDFWATWYRAGMLNAICQGPPLEEKAEAGELDEKVFRLAASFPLKRMDIPRKDSPFDRNEFLRQLT